MAGVDRCPHLMCHGAHGGEAAGAQHIAEIVHVSDFEVLAQLGVALRLGRYRRDGQRRCQRYGTAFVAVVRGRRGRRRGRRRGGFRRRRGCRRRRRRCRLRLRGRRRGRCRGCRRRRRTVAALVYRDPVAQADMSVVSSLAAEVGAGDSVVMQGQSSRAVSAASCGVGCALAGANAAGPCRWWADRVTTAAQLEREERHSKQRQQRLSRPTTAVKVAMLRHGWALN